MTDMAATITLPDEPLPKGWPAFWRAIIATSAMILVASIRFSIVWQIARSRALRGDALLALFRLAYWLHWVTVGIAAVAAVGCVVASRRCSGRFRAVAVLAAATNVVILGQLVAVLCGWDPTDAVFKVIGLEGL